jgi:hypothetical protein
MKSLSRDNFKRIYESACPEWKVHLLGWFGSKFSVEDEIEIKESRYKLMREACTEPQYKLFDEIFGEDKPEETYRYGDEFMVEGGKFILSKVDSHKITLINISSFDKGNGWSSPIFVSNPQKITKEEMKEIVGEYSYELIK